MHTRLCFSHPDATIIYKPRKFLWFRWIVAICLSCEAEMMMQKYSSGGW